MYLVVAEDHILRIGYNVGRSPRIFNKKYDKLVMPYNGEQRLVGGKVYELKNSTWVEVKIII